MQNLKAILYINTFLQFDIRFQYQRWKTKIETCHYNVSQEILCFVIICSFGKFNHCINFNAKYCYEDLIIENVCVYCRHPRNSHTVEKAKVVWEG